MLFCRCTKTGPGVRRLGNLGVLGKMAQFWTYVDQAANRFTYWRSVNGLSLKEISEIFISKTKRYSDYKLKCTKTGQHTVSKSVTPFPLVNFPALISFVFWHFTSLLFKTRWIILWANNFLYQTWNEISKVVKQKTIQCKLTRSPINNPNVVDQQIVSRL